VDAQEPNPGRLAKRDEQRRQRRSIFMTVLIGATVTAILAGAAAFRIDDTNASTVKIVTTTTTKPPTITTEGDTEPNVTDPPVLVPSTLPPSNSSSDATSPPATTAPATTTTGPTTTTIATVPPPPPTAPPTTTPPGTPAKIVWHLLPESVTVQSGAQTTMTITATNEGGTTGSAHVPPCPAAPHKYSVVRAGNQHSVSVLDNTCHPGAQTVSVAPGQTVSWIDTISATTDATRYGAALAPGNYLVLVNGDPEPLMFLVMKVTS
jgi:hypothetical protein